MIGSVWQCQKSVYQDGRILREKATEIAGRLGYEDLKASNGWLDL